jgi:hypothetical protein
MFSMKIVAADGTPRCVGKLTWHSAEAGTLDFQQRRVAKDRQGLLAVNVPVAENEGCLNDAALHVASYKRLHPVRDNSRKRARKGRNTFVRKAVGIVIAYKNMVEAAGIEPASLTELPAATTCLVRKMFSATR